MIAVSWEKETGKGTGYHCHDSGCTSSVHQGAGTRGFGRGCGVADLSLAKHNKIAKFSCTDTLRLVHSSGNPFQRTTREKLLQMGFLMSPSAEK